MLTPNKHMNLDLSVLRISAILLRVILKNNLIKYQDLLNKVVNEAGEDSKVVFIQALNFLYIINKINYDLKLDSFVLISEEKNEIK
jgi:hypothetical protein